MFVVLGYVDWLVSERDDLRLVSASAHSAAVAFSRADFRLAWVLDTIAFAVHLILLRVCADAWRYTW